MAQFFIRRPIVAIVISILMVLMGVYTLTSLNFEQYPFLAPPTIKVTANYPGASAVAVEQSVATPIEQEVNGVDKMIYMQSSNTSDGRMSLEVNFQVGDRSGHRQRAHPEPGGLGPGPPAPGGQRPGRDGEEAEPEHPDAHLGLLAQRVVRRQLPDQLLRHQPARSAPAHSRHRSGRSLRRRRLRHAGVDTARQARQARAHARRRDQLDQGAESPGSRREGRRGAHSEGPGIHLYGGRPQPARRRPRSSRTSSSAGRRAPPRCASATSGARSWGPRTTTRSGAWTASPPAPWRCTSCRARISSRRRTRSTRP